MEPRGAMLMEMLVPGCDALVFVVSWGLGLHVKVAGPNGKSTIVGDGGVAKATKGLVAAVGGGGRRR